MRLIDASKLQTTTTYFGISDTPVEVVKKSVIDNAKTVEAVSLSVIEKITTEIEELTKCPYGTECLGANCPTNTDCMICGEHVLDIIDKAVKECTHE